MSDKKSVILVDIDGTISDNRERWARYEQHQDKARLHLLEEVITDKPIEGVINVVFNDLAAWYDVILLTARHESDRGVTEAWLDKHRIKYKELIMEDVKYDMTGYVPASEYKRRKIRELKEKYDIVCMFEDDASCVAAAREEGITVFQVGYSNG